MFKILFTVALFSYAYSNESPAFRFDYEWSSQASGWLKFHPIPGTWDEARKRCYAEGAVLASPLNKALKAAMLSFVVRRKGAVSTAIYTGVHATFSKGDYSSIEGVHWLRMPIVWAMGEPDNYGNKESCLSMVTDNKGSMADINCDDVLPYICYKAHDFLTMNECGTTDPEYKLEPRTGSCYKFHSRGLVWSHAYMTCVAEGGHLVVIDSEEEMNVVKELYAKYPNEVIFSSSKHTLAVGFHDWGQRVSFLTIHGEPVENNYLVWSENEPNNLTNTRTGDEGEFCGSVGRNAQLNDIWCSGPVPFLCEKKPSSLLPL